MRGIQKVFTSGQAAKICKVAPRTLSKWVDSGRLVGYRIPGSNDRRIPRANLIAFLKEHSMPLGDLETAVVVHVLLLSNDPLLVPRLKELLPDQEQFRLHVASNGFEAGVMAEELHPAVLMLDLAMGRSECLHIAGQVRRNTAHDGCLLVALASEDETGELAAHGFDVAFYRPLDVERLATVLLGEALA